MRWTAKLGKWTAEKAPSVRCQVKRVNRTADSLRDYHWSIQIGNENSDTLGENGLLQGPVIFPVRFFVAKLFSRLNGGDSKTADDGNLLNAGTESKLSKYPESV